MTRLPAIWLGATALCAGFLVGCGGSGGPGGTMAAAGSAGVTNVPSGGSAGMSQGGSVAMAGADTAGMTSTGGGGESTSGAAGMGGMSMAGAGGGAGGSGGMTSTGNLAQGPFTCTQYIGAYLSMEWWNSGFETKVDNAKWQLKWHHHGHVSEWQKPDCPFWLNEGDPMDDLKGAPIQSKCTAGGDAPDRVVFLMIDWELLTEQEWLDGMNKIVDNVKAKIPSAKRMDVMTLVRCPNNMMCNPGAMYGPGANDSASLQDCYVPPYADSAIQKLIAQHPDFVALGPEPQMAMCNPAHNGAHMTADGNTQAAIDIAAFYAQRP